MEPRIEMRDGVTVMGVEAPCKFEPGYFEKLWTEGFMPREAEIKPFSPDRGYYSLYYCEGPERGVQVLDGMAVEGVTEAPEGLVLKECPPGQYAVIETRMANISQTWNELNEHWLMESAWERADTPDIEYYPPSDDPDAGMPVVIAIPVRLRAERVAEPAPAALA